MQLLLGCGRSREKKLHLQGQHEWRDLRTLDMTPDVGPDVVHDLTDMPLPFDENSADEIHLYDVLEHTQRQGEWRGFFSEFAEFWRILKPGGHLFAICPNWDGVWAWGDPGHTRVIQPESLTYLSQAAYTAECDGPVRTNRTDYRFLWRGDFDLVWTGPYGQHQTGFVLRAVKPSRWRPPA
jgi:SAM-dependent methyltransferase